MYIRKIMAGRLVMSLPTASHDMDWVACYLNRHPGI